MEWADAPYTKPKPAPKPTPTPVRPPGNSPKKDPGKKPSPPGYRPPAPKPPSRRPVVSRPSPTRPTPTPPPYKPYLPLPALKSSSSNAALLSRVASISRRLPSQSRVMPYAISRYLPAALRIVNERIRRDRDEEERRKRAAAANAARYQGQVNPWTQHAQAQQEARIYPTNEPPLYRVTAPAPGAPTPGDVGVGPNYKYSPMPVGQPVPYRPPAEYGTNPPSQPATFRGTPPAGQYQAQPVGQPVPMAPHTEAFNYQYSPIPTGAYPTNEQYPPNMTGFVMDEYGNQIIAPVHAFGPNYDPIEDFSNRYYPAVAAAQEAAAQAEAAAQTGGGGKKKGGGGSRYYPRRYYGSSGYSRSYGGGGGGSAGEFAQYGITPEFMEQYKAFWGQDYPEKHWPIFQQAMELFARYLGRMPQMDDWQAMWQAMKDQPVAEGQDPRKNSYYDIAKWEPIVTGMMRQPQPVAPDISYGPGLSF